MPASTSTAVEAVLRRLGSAVAGLRAALPLDGRIAGCDEGLHATPSSAEEAEARLAEAYGKSRLSKQTRLDAHLDPATVFSFQASLQMPI